MARLPFAQRSEIPEELRYVWDKNTTQGVLPDIFRVMANNAVVWRAYLRMGSALWSSCGLDPARRELAILRAAILQHSAYEWHQHVRIGRQAGLSNERIVGLHHWRVSELYSESERALLGYVDALAASDHPPADAHETLAAHFPPTAVAGINLLVGYYVMTAKFLGAMEIAPEGAFVGWQLSG